LPREDASAAEIESSPAVRLPRDRAGAVRKDLAVDAHTLSTMVPGNADRPGVGLHQRAQHVHRRRLARPVRAEQRKDRAGANL
jgi:hypothetical protein